MAPAPITEPYFTPVYYVTGFTVIVLLLGLIAPRGPNVGIIRTCVMMSAVCMYMFWLVVYMAQMNPIMCPKVPNTSLAWISEQWGLKAPK